MQRGGHRPREGRHVDGHQSGAGLCRCGADAGWWPCHARRRGFPLFHHHDVAVDQGDHQGMPHAGHATRRHLHLQRPLPRRNAQAGCPDASARVLGRRDRGLRQQLGPLAGRGRADTGELPGRRLRCDRGRPLHPADQDRLGRCHRRGRRKADFGQSASADVVAGRHPGDDCLAPDRREAAARAVRPIRQGNRLRGHAGVHSIFGTAATLRHSHVARGQLYLGRLYR